MNDFYLVLASNAAQKMYPNNAAHHFHNPLAHSLHLDGKWRVSLQEITYENSIQTIVDEQIRVFTRPAAVIQMEKMEDFNSEKKKLKFVIITPRIGGGADTQILLNETEVKNNGYGAPFKILQFTDKGEKGKEIVMVKGELSIEIEALKAGYKYEIWGTKSRYPADLIETFTIKPGYYSTEESLCNEINRVLNGKAAFDLENVGGEKYFRVQNLANNTRLELMKGLHFILGYGKTLVDHVGFRANRMSDLTRGTFAMFVYVDIVDTIMVGNVEAPLLRTVHLQKTERGQIVNHLFNPAFYMRVNKPNMNEIEVDIRTDSGEAFPFAKDSKIILTLHFERESDTSQTLLPPLAYYDDKKVYIQ